MENLDNSIASHAINSEEVISNGNQPEKGIWTDYEPNKDPFTDNNPKSDPFRSLPPEVDGDDLSKVAESHSSDFHDKHGMPY